MTKVRTKYTSPRAQQLEQIVRERVLVLDGAMGTMIQQYNLEEKDYRSARFADIEQDVKGNTRTPALCTVLAS